MGWALKYNIVEAGNSALFLGVYITNWDYADSSHGMRFSREFFAQGK